MVDNITLNNLLKEERERAISLGLELDTVDSKVSIDRSHSHYACCKYLSGEPYKYRIFISRYYLNAPIEEIRTVIMHEVLHTIKGSRGHDALWKNAAIMVRKHYNYVAGDYHLCDKPYSRDRRNLEHTQLEKAPKQQKNTNSYKYELQCVKCGYIFKYKRLSKVVRNCENRYHTRCGVEGKLIRIK